MSNDIWASTRPLPLDGEGTDDVPERSPLLDAKVMMVDDEPLMTDLIRTHLEEAGYGNVVATNDPRQALSLLRRERPGVLLLDLMMPGLSGFELLEAIRADRELRYTPVIVLTAATGADSKLRALRLGATDFLAKPVDESELVLRVRNTLAFRQYHERMTQYDAVTGLPREALFESAVDNLIEQQPLSGGLLALLSITVPECRSLREAVNQDVAGDLATVIARRLQGFAAAQAGRLGPAVDRRPRVARLGEERFALVLEGLENLDAVEARAQQVLAALSKTVPLGLHEVAPMPRIGVSTLPADGRSASALRQSADLAASHAHERAGPPLAFASPALNAKSYERILLSAQLRNAVARNELLLHYQPKVDIASGRIIGTEALLRWQHPERGLVAPGNFIPLAEELGLMGSIGDWVIHRACDDLAHLHRAGFGQLSVSINVAKPQLSLGQLDKRIATALSATLLPPGQLIIEFTESMLMVDVDRCLKLMLRLKSLGVRLSIDDFGTGYSSLAYLKQFPLDELKIDRSFVKDLPGNNRDRALLGTIVELGHSLDMSVTAEGVETDGQLTTLANLKCDVFQGFLFSRPVPLQELHAMLVRWRQQRP